MADHPANDNERRNDPELNSDRRNPTDQTHYETPMSEESRRLVEEQRSPAKPKDVRAGPGDAGASDRPEQLADNPQTERRRREAGPLIVGLLVATAIAIVLMVFL